MEYFRAIVATPLLSVLSVIAAIPLLRGGKGLIRRTDAAHVLFLIIATVAENLLLLSFDEHAFGDEFGLYLYVMLPFLLLMAVVAALAMIRILRSRPSDALLQAMSLATLAFMAIALFGAVSGLYPSAFPMIVHAYLVVSAALALVWFGYRRRALASCSDGDGTR